MNKKRIIIIICMVLLFLGVTATKIYYDIVYKKYSFYPIEIKNMQKNTSNNDVLDETTYKDNIITDDLLSLDYNFFDNKKSITGKIYIEDEYLYITDYNDNHVRKISNVKFKTMYKKDYQYSNGIYIYLLSNDSTVYLFKLESNNIKTAKVERIQRDYKIKNFTNLEFQLDKYESANTVFVLATDGNIYDLISNIRYDNQIKSLYNKFYVFSDNTITNIYGNPLKDKFGKDYKVKYVFNVSEDTNFAKTDTALIITKDNKVIYINDDNSLVYEFQEKIKSIDFNVKYPYNISELNILFEDDSTFKSNAVCNQFFCNCKLD